MADRAVEQIARAAASQVPGVATGQQSTGTVGGALGRAYPRVDCDVAGRRVRVQCQIATRWPLPAARVAAAVRDNISEQLRELADLDVDAVVVTVGKVVRAAAPAGRRVR